MLAEDFKRIRLHLSGPKMIAIQVKMKRCLQVVVMHTTACFTSAAAGPAACKTCPAAPRYFLNAPVFSLLTLHRTEIKDSLQHHEGTAESSALSPSACPHCNPAPRRVSRLLHPSCRTTFTTTA
jgi:hypothetical protein